MVLRSIGEGAGGPLRFLNPEDGDGDGWEEKKSKDDGEEDEGQE